MRRAGLILGLLALTGCGTVHNLGAGPKIYGGVRYNAAHMHGCAGWTFLFDQPGCAILDTLCLPFTLIFELTRALSGWPPAENF